MSICAIGSSGRPHRERGRSETTGPEKPEKVGPGHEGLTSQLLEMSGTGKKGHATGEV